MRAPLLLILLAVPAAADVESFSPPMSVVFPHRAAVTVPAPDVAHWKFDGDSTDSSANALHWGAFSTTATSYVAGVHDQALDWGSGSCTMRAGHAALTNAFAGDYTLAGWLYHRNATGSYNDWLIYSASTTARMFLFVTNSTRAPIIGWNKPDGSVIQYTVSYTFPLDTWVHAAVRRSGSTVEFWVNGAMHTQWTAQPAPIVPSSGLNAYLSRWEGSCGDLWPGMFDDMRVYGSALTDAQLAALAGT